MGSEWLDELWPGELADDELTESESDFYCPYTNGGQCPVQTKGWQPQELCEALECEQLRLIRQDRKKRRKAA